MRASATPLAVTIVLLLAGCITSDQAPTLTPDPAWVEVVKSAGANTFYHYAGGLPLDAGAILTGNLTPVLAQGGYHGIGTSTFEPSIGATKSGAVFMTSLKRDTVDRGTHIIRGTEHGSKWTDVGPFLGPTEYSLVLNSNDPFLYVDQITNRIINFDMCLTLSGFCMMISDDDGANWLVQNVVTGDSVALDHQSVAAAPPPAGIQTVGYPNILTFCVNRGTTATGSWCSTSRDGGLAWTPLLPGFPTNAPQCSGLSGHVSGSPDGRFYRGNPSCDGPAVYRSEDGGISWTEHTISTEVGASPDSHDVAVEADAAGNVYAFWISDDGLPYLAISTDHASTWSDPLMVAPEHVTATGFPALAAGDAGRVVFGYIGTDEDDGYDGVGTSTKWTGYLGMITDASDPDPLITTVAVNDPDTDPLAKGPCGNTRCGGFGDFIDLTIDPEGRPWVAMANNRHSNAGIVGTFLDGPALKGTNALLPHIDLDGPASLKKST